MPTQPPPTPAARPALRSLVVLNPLGRLTTAMFILGLLLLPVAALKAAEGNRQRAGTAGLLGLGLLLLTARKVARRNQPLLLTSDHNALHLEPLGRRLRQGQPAESIPLTSITAYSYWLRLLRWRLFAQYHLRLELADGRVLHLADRPGTRPDDPAGTVRLDAVARRLARRKTGPPRHPSFFLTRPARLLLWGSWGAVGAGGGLLWAGSALGIALLLLGAGYSAIYYLWRGADKITA